MDLLKNIDALLITNPTNIRYLTGFVGAAPEEREAYCLLTNSQTYLFINALYTEYANTLVSPSKQGSNNPIIQFSNNPIKIVKISRGEPFAKKLGDVLKRSHLAKPQGETLKGIRLGFEESNLTVAEFEKLKKELPGITLVPTQNRIEELRMIKRDDEIENIRQAAKITDQCFTYLTTILKPRVTELEIAWKIESFIRSRGAGLAFSPIVAFGSNTSQPHYSPKSSLKRSHLLRLKNQDIVLLDFGAKINGYCSDMTRMVFIGKPEAEWVNAYETVSRAQTMALEYLASRPGLEATGDKVDQIARDIIENAGFPTYPHSLGHGVGLDIHEAPRLRTNPSINSEQPVTSRASQRLMPGMVVTVEPGIYIEGQYGVRLEDLILLKEDGIELLSKSNKHITIL
ncbi:MAG: Xaa-Pro peptidase family protein [Candidatus Gottesmanbacteria bacterium]|nr:Xaa-Pro peptidase family protein [Candidatus Gottesmanbacteria bacterium]